METPAQQQELTEAQTKEAELLAKLYGMQIPNGVRERQELLRGLLTYSKTRCAGDEDDHD